MTEAPERIWLTNFHKDEYGAKLGRGRPVTVAEAAKGALMVEKIDDVSDICKQFKLSEPHFRAALRALSEG